ncbi:Retrotransposon protein [Musa troglodytarum]|uniref:Retrotransposon protein n=1 Tax=Musa troglodytarum TaxID=320322 RepID=A0A9E7I328_9LILI|nr:Retrotransposon protein [Musa troglodytarum]
MKFIFTALKIFYVLDPNLQPIPDLTDNDTDEVKAERKKRNEDEVMCRGHILNALLGRLYDLYNVEPSAKAIWNALEFKYQAEEKGTKKFLILKYFDYKFVDDKLAQVHELQVIVNQLKAEKIKLPEPFQVRAIIAKLPSSWKGYRKKILHDSKEITLEQIQKHLRIKEESRMRDKSENSFNNIKANVVKQPKNSNKGKQNKKNHLGPKRDQGKFKKPKSGGCFVCEKLDHFARDYRFKKGQKPEVNSVEGDDNIIATVSEVNVIFGKVFGWWYNTCAIVHVCYDKTLLKTYREVTNGQQIQMGNKVRSKIIGKGNVELTFTSGKKVTLTNVLHISYMSRNLMSENLLGKPGIKSVFESGKLILSHNETFVGKDYSTKGMVKLCIVDNDFEFNKDVAFVYIIDSCSLWHNRLAHIGTSTIKRMVKCDLINYHFNNFYKYKICVKSKMMKKSFKSIKRHTNLLDLIYSDICELNGMIIRGGNRYFITFINDMSRFTYVYLLKHKNDAFNAFKAYKAEVENQLG